jgi:predicted negative regulator of RcsB-dependent stress response
MVSQDYSRVETLLAPFFGQAKPPRYEMFLVLASAHHKRSEWDKALQVIDQGISHYGLNTALLNLRGDCYLRLGNKTEALRALEKSLELNPAQEDVRKAVAALKRQD